MREKWKPELLTLIRLPPTGDSGRGGYHLLSAGLWECERDGVVRVLWGSNEGGGLGGGGSAQALQRTTVHSRARLRPDYTRVRPWQCVWVWEWPRDQWQCCLLIVRLKIFVCNVRWWEVLFRYILVKQWDLNTSC